MTSFCLPRREGSDGSFAVCPLIPSLSVGGSVSKGDTQPSYKQQFLCASFLVVAAILAGQTQAPPHVTFWDGIHSSKSPLPPMRYTTVPESHSLAEEGEAPWSVYGSPLQSPSAGSVALKKVKNKTRRKRRKQAREQSANVPPVTVGIEC